MSMERSNRALKEVALLFLRLGATAFGGPAAHIAMMEDEVVRRKKWLSSTQFMDMLAATNFIPGPNSTEMAIHVGYERAGIKGLLVAGISFIAPAVLIVMAIAWAYTRYGSLPIANDVLYGVKPVVIAVIVQAIWRLTQNTVKTKTAALIGLLAAAANWYGIGELKVLFSAACITGGLEILRRHRIKRTAHCFGLPILLFSANPMQAAGGLVVIAATTVAVNLSQIFFVFLKIGSVLFGSGYVLLAFLRSDLVEKLGWLTESQLLDATAIGQVTPGPVFTTATFIGYLLSGPSGALIATLGIFLPAFLFVALSAPLLPSLRNSKLAANVLDGLNVASLALMAVVTLQLGQVALMDWTTVLIALLSAVLLIVWRVNSTWLVSAGALVGVVLHR